MKRKTKISATWIWAITITITTWCGCKITHDSTFFFLQYYLHLCGQQCRRHKLHTTVNQNKSTSTITNKDTNETIHKLQTALEPNCNCLKLISLCFSIAEFVWHINKFVPKWMLCKTQLRRFIDIGGQSYRKHILIEHNEKKKTTNVFARNWGRNEPALFCLNFIVIHWVFLLKLCFTFFDGSYFHGESLLSLVFRALFQRKNSQASQQIWSRAYNTKPPLISWFATIATDWLENYFIACI